MTKSDNVKSTLNSVEPTGLIVGHAQIEIDALVSSIRGIFSTTYHQQIPRIAVAVQATAIDDNSDKEMPELIAVDND